MEKNVDKGVLLVTILNIAQVCGFEPMNFLPLCYFGFERKYWQFLALFESSWIMYDIFLWTMNLSFFPPIAEKKIAEENCLLGIGKTAGPN